MILQSHDFYTSLSQTNEYIIVLLQIITTVKIQELFDRSSLIIDLHSGF